ncbi:hypothetical protein Poly30_28330 [Planctomycetes bacterium Poly30]|uniref:Flippase-like domain-containing protein n=1 Tax=Saltatorellus ferox TaxID=2528018 RepID=A0A518ET92_9BACT|nr:hypothetical protein Poly30_28330 [Planctomycetes bacterium Poly30]
MNPSDPHEGQPDAEPGAEPDSVFDEIRRERSSQSFAKSAALRLIGLTVVALAAWIISRNVSWTDTLVLENATGKVELPGTIAGDWRSTEIEFEMDVEAAGEAPLAPLGLDAADAAALEESRDIGRPWMVRKGELILPGGRVLLVVEGTPDAQGARPAKQIDWRPGMVRTFREIRVLQLIPALGFLILASLCVATRWWRILILNHCRTSWYNAFRFTYSGLFFNAVVPGINGGDVARAIAVVRHHPTRRAEAFMTVVVDRVIGLIGMILVGTVLVLTTDERLAPLRLPVSLFCGAILLGAVLFFHPSVRRLVRFDALVQKLPQSERLLRLDATARKLLHSPAELGIALVFSFGNHVFNGLAVYTAASALGSTLGFQDWMTTMAISNTLAAVPLSPGGLGVGEVLFGSLAEMLGSSYALGVATSLVYRLCLYAMSLLGGLVMLLPAGPARGPASGPESEPESSAA